MIPISNRFVPLISRLREFTAASSRGVPSRRDRPPQNVPRVHPPAAPGPSQVPVDVEDAEDTKGLSRWQKQKKLAMNNQSHRQARCDDDDEANAVAGMNNYQRQKYMRSKAKEQAAARAAEEDDPEKEEAQNYRHMTPWQRKKYLMNKLKGIVTLSAVFSLRTMDTKTVGLRYRRTA